MLPSRGHLEARLRGKWGDQVWTPVGSKRERMQARGMLCDPQDRLEPSNPLLPHSNEWSSGRSSLLHPYPKARRHFSDRESGHEAFGSDGIRIPGGSAAHCPVLLASPFPSLASVSPSVQGGCLDRGILLGVLNPTCLCSLVSVRFKDFPATLGPHP